MSTSMQDMIEYNNGKGAINWKLWIVTASLASLEVLTVCPHRSEVRLKVYINKSMCGSRNATIYSRERISSFMESGP